MKFSLYFSAPVVALCFLQRTAALPSTSYGYTRNPSNWGLVSRADEIDYEDQSWIKKWAAIGDSYAAGIGAGNKLDSSCSRYDASYPNLINNDSRMGTGQTFQFLACSGATSADIVKNQIPKLSSGQQVITISSGGNDVGLVTILNHCVYTWSAFNNDCDAVLQDSSNQISNNLPGNIDNLLAAAKTKLDPAGTIYITGYAKFWDDTTADCDKVSWHYWPFPIGYLTWQYLTQARRTKMNSLVDAVNQQISNAVDRANSASRNFVFVEYDKYYGDLGGRYCEPGVAEPDANRADLLFYESKTKEDLVVTKRDSETLSNDTFEGEINYLVAQTMAEYPNVTLPDSSDINTDAAASFLASPNEGNLDVALPSLISDTTKRVFHPMQIGHSLIANLVLYYMSVTRAAVLHTVAAPESEDAFSFCPADPRGIACAGKNTMNIPTRLVLSDGTVDQPGLLFKLRADVCTNQCVVPPGIDSRAVAIWQNDAKTECEISVAIEGGVEAWVYRGTPSTGTEWQQCWDSTESIIEVCIAAQGASSGWWNGQDFGQFYQTGLRPLNDPSAKHLPFSEGGTVVHSPSGNENLATISPSKYDGTIDCLDKSDGTGADTTNTYWLAGDEVVQGQRLSATQQICTSNPSTSCIQSGTTVRKGVKISNWCLVYQQGNAGLVIADRYQDFGGGATGNSCIQGQQMINIAKNGPLSCSGKSKAMVQMGLGPDGKGMIELGLSLQTVCVVNVAHPEVCVAP